MHRCEIIKYPAIVFIIFLLISSVCFAYDFAGGTGSPNDPYQIETAAQLLQIGSDANLLDKCYILINDINLAPDVTGIPPFTQATIAPDINTSEPGFQGIRFTGIFDGNDNTILNLNINTLDDYIALFGKIGPDAEVKNLNIESAFIKGNNYVGALSGYQSSCHVLSCTTNVQIDANSFVGGISGNGGGVIEKCSSNGNIVGIEYVGGIAGYCSNTIKGCYSIVSITGYNNVGGIAGWNFAQNIIQSCYFAGSVSGVDIVGGLVGLNQSTISDSYSVGQVLADSNGGGLIGLNSGTVYLSYWDYETSNILTSDGGNPKSTTEMKSIDTFKGWGYEEQWKIENGLSSPTLIWQNLPGEIIIDDPNRYAGGTGEPNEPFKIENAEHLANIAYYRSDFDKNFILTKDIDCNSIDQNNLIPIGRPNIEFTGVFDGNNHSIYNYTYQINNSYVGIFGCVGVPTLSHKSYDAIKNLRLVNADIYGGNYVGGLIGKSWFANVINCSMTGSVMGNDYVGGLVGKSLYSNITSSYSSANVSGDYGVGILVGSHGTGAIIKSYSEGNVTGDWQIGGLVGFNGGNIYSSYSNVFIVGNLDVGGLAGASGGEINSECEIMDCNSSSTVSGYDHVGGLVGKNNGTILNSYSDGQVIGGDCVGALVGINRPKGFIINCFSSGPVHANDCVGGLVGFNNEGVIETSYSYNIVIGDTKVGGLVGGNCKGTIFYSFSNSEVVGDSDIGGLVGRDWSYSYYIRRIKVCYSNGNVEGNIHVGGFIGYSEGPIYQCYSTGKVIGTEYVGGFAGYKWGYSIDDCFWDVNTSDMNDGVGNADPDPNGITGLPTEQMQTASTFIDASWNFNHTWAICEGTNYPRLQWQILPADFLCPDGVDFLDYAHFSYYWLNVDCADSNDCEGADFDDSGCVDANDLDIFTTYWLFGK